MWACQRHPSSCPAFTSQRCWECCRPSDGNYHVPSDTWWQKQRPPIAWALQQLQKRTSLTCISDPWMLSKTPALVSLDGADQCTGTGVDSSILHFSNRSHYFTVWTLLISCSKIEAIRTVFFSCVNQINLEITNRTPQIDTTSSIMYLG